MDTTDEGKQVPYPAEGRSNPPGGAGPSRRPVWELAADPGPLDPGVPEGLDRRPAVLVVGGGVVGLATAALCRRAGLGRVVVLERGRLAAGPSGRAAGIMAPELHHGSAPPALVELGRRSLDTWRDLDGDWAGELGVEPLDVLEALPDGEVPAAPPPPGARVLRAEQARALAPGLPAGSGGVLVPGQARADPLRLAAALARRAGTVATGVEMLALQAAAGGVRVRSSAGDLHPGAVVLATGTAPAVPGLPAFADGLVKGLLIATEPAPFRLRAGVLGRGGLVLQLRDGRLVFGNTYDPHDTSELVRPEAVAATAADLRAVLPGADGLGVEYAWSCLRPATPDRLPVIDRLEGLGRVWVCYGQYRTGILMAAATGRALAAWIASGTRPAELAPFAAARPGVA